jgi:putative membrane protein
MRRLSILLALLGLAVAAALVLRFDARDVLRAALSVGWLGALTLLLWQGLLFVLLGLAWSCVQPGVRTRVLIWGRMVRDAATTCLPFSPVGGYVIGARAVTLRGPPWEAAAAGTVVDVTAELTAQLLFALFGLAVLLLARPGSGLILLVGVGVACAIGLLLIAFRQRGRIGRVVQALSGRLLGASLQSGGGLDRLRAEMERLYANLPRLLLGTMLHLAGWFGTGVGTWISLRLLGHPVDIVGVIALEALLDAVIAVAFVVPGAAGVQEAGYVGLGAVFGVPPDIALSVSLLRRAREVGWGLPVLGIWQWQEVRRL